MSNVKTLKSYNIVYLTVSPSGIIDMSYQKQKIEAGTKEDAINIIRTSVSDHDGSTIRISKIENLNAPPKREQKKKRSVFGLVAFSIFILATAAKLISRLF